MTSMLAPAAPSTRAGLMLMVRSLLADCFRLLVHRRTKEIATNVLVEAAFLNGLRVLLTRDLLTVASSARTPVQHRPGRNGHHRQCRQASR
jgi:uncharacterized protein (TIGR03435 family)